MQLSGILCFALYPKGGGKLTGQLCCAGQVLLNGLCVGAVFADVSKCFRKTFLPAFDLTLSYRKMEGLSRKSRRLFVKVCSYADCQLFNSLCFHMPDHSGTVKANTMFRIQLPSGCFSGKISMRLIKARMNSFCSTSVATGFVILTVRFGNIPVQAPATAGAFQDTGKNMRMVGVTDFFTPPCGVLTFGQRKIPVIF